MSEQQYLTAPVASEEMPKGIPYIIGNEAAERFSFYGMKGILTIFMTKYLFLLDETAGTPMDPSEAISRYHEFTSLVYLTPVLGAFLADTVLGKYRTILSLSIVYCLGHLALAFMGAGGISAENWMLSGLYLIALGSGGIKPCVSAHVGDQFGEKNQHLITKIFNIFYFSINFGAVISNLLIPWVLKWHGPHLAFGVPGVLMALATLFFWMGREKFAHIPAKGSSFLKELFSKEGLSVIGKLIPLVLFVGMFWCLFDQTASRLVFQAERMDRNIFGLEVLPSQIQAANPFLILVLIPVFTFFIYPQSEKIIKLTPLRKIGAGLFLMAVSFVVVSLSQEAIDRGETPHVGWQILAYVILTSGEVMVSIVALEFFYTQAPKKMKSLMMAIFLTSVSVGNSFTAIVNHVIQVASPEEVSLVEEFSEGNQTKLKRIAGYDGKFNTPDDIVTGGERIESLITEVLGDAAGKIESYLSEKEKLPLEWTDLPDDPWGSPIKYQLVSAKEARLSSDGPDKIAKTVWDLGINITVKEAKEDLRGTWLYEEKKRRGLIEEKAEDDQSPISTKYTAGGGLTLDGAEYYWFFTKLMIGTVILFIPFAMLYKPRTYLHGNSEEGA